MPDWMGRYLGWMGQGFYSPLTIRSARYNLRAYARSLMDQWGLRPEEAQEKTIEAYLLDQAVRSKVSTLRNIHRFLKGFYHWLLKEGVILYNPTQAIPRPKGTVELKTIPSAKEVAVLLTSIPIGQSLGLRDRAIFELLYSSGLRSKELQEICLKNIDLKGRVLEIPKDKPRRGRLVPVGRAAAFWIERYLKEARPRFHKKGSDRLFLSEDGTPLPEGSLHKRLKNYTQSIEHLKPFTPHGLRHACALHMLRGGAGLASIQRLLGHACLGSTQIYLKLCVDDLHQVLQKHHPRNKIHLCPP